LFEKKNKIKLKFGNKIYLVIIVVRSNDYFCKIKKK